MRIRKGAKVIVRCRGGFYYVGEVSYLGFDVVDLEQASMVLHMDRIDRFVAGNPDEIGEAVSAFVDKVTVKWDLAIPLADDFPLPKPREDLHS